MVVGNYSNRACWWLTACTQKGEASRTCFLVFSFGVFSHVSSPPSSISPSSPSLPSPLLIPSALRSPVIFSFSRLPLPLHSSFTSSRPSLLSLTLLSSPPLFFSSFVPSPSSSPSLYPSPSVLSVSPLLSRCRETAVRTLSPLSLAAVI